jgi:Zn-dependent protease with chaperone function
MVLELVTQYLSVPFHVVLLVVAWELALIAYFRWRSSNRPLLVYVHLALLLTPLVHLGSTIQCDMNFFSGLMSLCSSHVAKFGLLTLPFVLVGAVFGGFVVLPLLYVRRFGAKRIDVGVVRSAAGKAGVRVPKVYVFDGQEPQAFTVHNRIFASVGLFDLLSEKELESVFLHELGHVRVGANWRKFSALMARVFSPLAAFTPLRVQVEKEEAEADAFAVRVQGTSRFLGSAKRKIREFAKYASQF